MHTPEERQRSEAGKERGWMRGRNDSASDRQWSLQESQQRQTQQHPEKRARERETEEGGGSEGSHASLIYDSVNLPVLSLCWLLKQSRKDREKTYM